MKKILLVLIFLWTQGAALSLDIIPPYPAPGAVGLDSGFYGESQGNINLRIGKNSGESARLYAEIDGPLTSPEGYQLPADALQWQIYYWTGQESGTPRPGISAGFDSWVPYRRSPAEVLQIFDNVSTIDQLQLGTTVRRIPSVQPEGVYTTRIRFTLTP